jgi:hypothetical protein
MNRKTNKFHRDLQHPTKKELQKMSDFIQHTEDRFKRAGKDFQEMNKLAQQRRIESVKNDLDNLDRKHDSAVATLRYINTEILLLQAELDVLLGKKEASPLEDINACAKMLGIIQ